MGLDTTASLATLPGMLKPAEIAAPEIRAFSLADVAEALAAVGTGHVRGRSWWP